MTFNELKKFIKLNGFNYFDVYVIDTMFYGREGGYHNQIIYKSNELLYSNRHRVPYEASIFENENTVNYKDKIKYVFYK